MSDAQIARSRGIRRSSEHAYLTFSLGSEVYAIPILRIREIIGITDITPVPRLAPHVRGVLNLRGKVIPVIDLRLRLRLPQVADHRRTCIVIVQVQHADEALHIGIVIDRVQEVRDIPAEAIEPPGSIVGDVDQGCFTGIGKLGKQVILILAIDQIATIDAIQNPDSTTTAA